MKQLAALLAAAVITGLVACGMLLIGMNAVLSPTSVFASDSPASPVPGRANDAGDSAQVTELQNELAQYRTQL